MAKIQGLSSLEKKLLAMPVAAKTEIKKAIEASASEMVSLAKSLAPIKSGDLINSIGYTFGKYKAANSNVRGVTAGGADHELAVTIHAGDEKAFYAAWVEFGTAAHVNGGKFAGTQHPGSTAHPYFFPAYRVLKKRAKGRITRAVKKAARAAAGG